MTILIIAEHNNQSLKTETAKTIGAANQIGDDIHVLVLGSDCKGAAEQAALISGVSKVWLADQNEYAHQLPENIALLVEQVAKNYSHIVSAATTTGKNFMPRVAALLDVEQVSDIIAVQSANTYQRPIYAGNAIATVQNNEAIQVITVRTSAFDAASNSDTAAPIEMLDETHDLGVSNFVSEALTESERPELTAASVIISGGRGMQNGENFAMLEKVADKLGAAIGASRAAVDAGFVPNDMQVGQTGKVVAPDLYIAVGISGAIQHLSGMKDSKVIVAINKDEEAPIFQVADYGLVADLFEAVPELSEKL
jgi:electron transfer flavoprotein alpha subunit